jgi:hypothetical protein
MPHLKLVGLRVVLLLCELLRLNVLAELVVAVHEAAVTDGHALCAVADPLFLSITLRRRCWQLLQAFCDASTSSSSA